MFVTTCVNNTTVFLCIIMTQYYEDMKLSQLSRSVFQTIGAFSSFKMSNIYNIYTNFRNLHSITHRGNKAFWKAKNGMLVIIEPLGFLIHSSCVLSGRTIEAKMPRYSNTQWLVGSWIMVILEPVNHKSRKTTWLLFHPHPGSNNKLTLQIPPMTAGSW